MLALGLILMLMKSISAAGISHKDPMAKRINA